MYRVFVKHNDSNDWSEPLTSLQWLDLTTVTVVRPPGVRSGKLPVHSCPQLDVNRPPKFGHPSIRGNQMGHGGPDMTLQVILIDLVSNLICTNTLLFLRGPHLDVSDWLLQEDAALTTCPWSSGRLDWCSSLHKLSLTPSLRALGDCQVPHQEPCGPKTLSSPS